MRCPHCASLATIERSDRTALGYRRFSCRDCQRAFNERTGTVFNRQQYPTDVVCLVILWRFRYKLSLRDLAEMFLQLVYPRTVYTDLNALMGKMKVTVERKVTFDTAVLFERPAEIGQDAHRQQGLRKSLRSGPSVPLWCEADHFSQTGFTHRTSL